MARSPRYPNSSGRSRTPGRIVLIVSVALVIASFYFFDASDFTKVDRCLDAGGRWNDDLKERELNGIHSRGGVCRLPAQGPRRSSALRPLGRLETEGTPFATSHAHGQRIATSKRSPLSDVSGPPPRPLGTLPDLSLRSV